MNCQETYDIHHGQIQSRASTMEQAHAAELVGTDRLGSSFVEKDLRSVGTSCTWVSVPLQQRPAASWSALGGGQPAHGEKRWFSLSGTY